VNLTEASPKRKRNGRTERRSAEVPELTFSTGGCGGICQTVLVVDPRVTGMRVRTEENNFESFGMDVNNKLSSKSGIRCGKVE
jgi:hypothetical protein